MGVMVSPDLQPARRSLSWRLGSSLAMCITGVVARGFLYGLNTVETVGIEAFLKLLDDRRAGRSKQGLLTGTHNKRRPGSLGHFADI